MEKILNQFNEVVKVIPFDRLGINGRDEQTLYGDVLDWCRDYFNEPKNHVLAMMLVGEYYTQQEMKYYEKKRK